MQKRFLSIWFCSLSTDWCCRRQPGLAKLPFVLSTPDHGRMIVTAANLLAQQEGISLGMALADARAIYPSLQVQDDDAGLSARLLTAIAEWCIRFTPTVAVDMPDGLILDITGCAHLWGGEEKYVSDLNSRFKGFQYHVRTAIADTIGAAWAKSRFGNDIFSLPPAALRIERETKIGRASCRERV